MDAKLRNAVIAGVLAAIIWTVLSMLAGASVGPTLAWAVVFLVGVAAVTWLISALLERARGPRSRAPRA